jgi:hypothetical protein
LLHWIRHSPRARIIGSAITTVVGTIVGITVAVTLRPNPLGWALPDGARRLGYIALLRLRCGLGGLFGSGSGRRRASVIASRRHRAVAAEAFFK